MQKMVQNTHEAVTTLVDVSRAKYGDHAYAAGYFSSMVSGMIDEMRVRGSKEMTQMADYYERLLLKSIINILKEK
jgi:hypothetical protein